MRRPQPCSKHPNAPKYINKSRSRVHGCLECIRLRAKAYYTLHKSSHNNRTSKRTRKVRHNGDDRPPFRGLCPICKKERLLIYDHCHKTGAFRGWICQGCNTGLGNLGDNLEGLMKAVEYLRLHSVGSCSM